MKLPDGWLFTLRQDSMRMIDADALAEFVHEYVLPKSPDGLVTNYDEPIAPRLMSLEEVAGMVALEQEITIYMEFGPMATHAGKVIGLIPKYMYFDDEHGLSWDVCEGPNQGKGDGVSLYEYNNIWRCWTLRPSDAQMEEAPWK